MPCGHYGKIPRNDGNPSIEQAAEHLAAHALYQIEANHVEKVEYTAAMVKELLDIE